MFFYSLFCSVVEIQVIIQTLLKNITYFCPFILQNKFNMLFVEKIKQLREEHQMLQQHLMAALHINTVTYFKIGKSDKKTRCEQVTIRSQIIYHNNQKPIIFANSKGQTIYNGFIESYLLKVKYVCFYLCNFISSFALNTRLSICIQPYNYRVTHLSFARLMACQPLHCDSLF